MTKYLDQTGLSIFWNKIKSTFIQEIHLVNEQNTQGITYTSDASGKRKVIISVATDKNPGIMSSEHVQKVNGAVQNIVHGDASNPVLFDKIDNIPGHEDEDGWEGPAIVLNNADENSDGLMSKEDYNTLKNLSTTGGQPNAAQFDKTVSKKLEGSANYVSLDKTTGGSIQIPYVSNSSDGVMKAAEFMEMLSQSERIDRLQQDIIDVYYNENNGKLAKKYGINSEDEVEILPLRIIDQENTALIIIAENHVTVPTIAGMEAAIAAVPHLKRKIVTSLPSSDIDENTIYMVKQTGETGQNVYIEYMRIDNNWEIIGDTSIEIKGIEASVINALS